MNPLGNVVIDTSTLVGAVLRPDSKPRQAFMKAVSNTVICVSQSTLQELQVVLNRRKFDRYASLANPHRFFGFGYPMGPLV